MIDEKIIRKTPERIKYLQVGDNFTVVIAFNKTSAKKEGIINRTDRAKYSFPTFNRSIFNQL